LSYVVTPSAEFNLADEASARRLVRTYVLPGLTRITTSSSIRTA
jgi:hypothetical protein